VTRLVTGGRLDEGIDREYCRDLHGYGVSIGEAAMCGPFDSS
jgi:hypothetical protein